MSAHFCLKTARTQPKYQRILLKLSGEAFRDEDTGQPIDGATVSRVCQEIKCIHELGVEVGLVVGGGNIFRGVGHTSATQIKRTTGDMMGMLATVINGLALREGLEQIGVAARVQSAIPMDAVTEPFILGRALSHLKKKRVIIFVGGIGSPYFSTDTTAALRGKEISAEIMMKATKVDGIYNKDPLVHSDAVKFEHLSFVDTLNQSLLRVMDTTAFSLCCDNQLPVLVFNMTKPGNFYKAVMGESIGTVVD